jgi:hypothetical protein
LGTFFGSWKANPTETRAVILTAFVGIDSVVPMNYDLNEDESILIIQMLNRFVVENNLTDGKSAEAKLLQKMAARNQQKE